MTFSTAFGSDLGEVETLAREAAAVVVAEHPEAVAGATPIVRLRGFVDGGVSVLVGVRVHAPNAGPAVRSALVREIYERLADAGVQIGAVAAESPPTSPPPPAPGFMKPK